VYHATLLIFVALFSDLRVDFEFGCIEVGFCHGLGWRCMQGCGGQVDGFGCCTLIFFCMEHIRMEVGCT
jgi:hypothetical protein